MNQEQEKYKFDNLQPISYLQKFNKMVQNDEKYPLKVENSDYKIMPLSKFPLPDVYRKMEGIFQSGIKQNEVTGIKIKTKEDLQDEQFLDRHQRFMKRTIEKIIEDNEKYQQSLNIYKKQYEKTSSGEINPLKSQKREKPQFRDRLITRKGSQAPFSQDQARNKLKNLQDETQKDELRLTLMEKLQKQRLQSLKQRKERISLRKPQKIKQFLETRKNFMSQRKLPKPNQQEVNYDNMTLEDRKKVFVEGMIDLQQHQNKVQNKYATKIENQIKILSQQVNLNIKKTNQKKFY